MRRLTKVLFSFLVILMFLPRFGLGNNLKINGHIQNIPEGTKVYLVRTATKDTLGYSIVKLERFYFAVKAENGCEYFRLILSDSALRLPPLLLALGNEDVTINGSLEDWPSVSVSGSSSQKAFEHYKQYWDSITKPVIEIIEKSKQNELAINDKTENKDTLAVAMLLNKKRLLDEELAFQKSVRKSQLISFILLNKSNFYAPAIIKGLDEIIDLDETVSLYDSLSDKVKQSHFGKQLAQEIKYGIDRKGIMEYAIIPDFNVVIKGKTYSIREIAQRSEYTFIDIWASWCIPCKKAIPQIKKVYSKYLQDGLGIISIAVADSRSKWEEANEELQIPWISVFDKDAVQKRFDIGALPAYILLDRQARLIAFSCYMSKVKVFGPSLKPEDLDTTIQKLREVQ